MKGQTMRFKAALAMLLLPVAPSLGGSLPSQFKLADYMPGDVWLYMNFVENPESAWLNEQWDQVFDALAKSGIDRDMIGMISMIADKAAQSSATDPAAAEAQAADVQAKIERLQTLIHRIPWRGMAVEMAFGMRMAELPLPYDYFIFMRNEPDKAQECADAVTALVQELVGWTDKINFETSDMGGVQVHKVALAEVPNPQDKLQFTSGMYLIHKGEFLGVVIGSDSDLKDVLSRLAGKGKDSAITSSKRFAKALDEVKEAEEGVVFFDGPVLFEGLANLMSTAAAAAGETPEAKEQAERKMRPIQKMIDMINVMDYSVVTVETDGRAQRHHEITRLREDKADSPVCSLFMNRKPFASFDTFIPKDANSFMMTGFIDLKGAYDLVIDFIRKEVPEGEAMIASWDSNLQQFGFDPQEAIFSWLGGELITVDLPPAVVTPMSTSDSVLMVRVTDAKKAREKIDAGLEWVNMMMTGGPQGQGQAQGQPQGPGGQGLTIMPAEEVQAEGFRYVTHPMFAMMMLKPVIGFYDEWMIIGTSAGGINKCLAVAKGEAPSIKENARFKKEGFELDGPVYSASFTDTSQFGQELAAAVGMVGMFGGMATAQIPEPDAKKVVQNLLSMLMKMGPVLQKLDFYSSDSTVVTRKGNVFRSEYTITYKSAEELQAQESGN